MQASVSAASSPRNGQNGQEGYSDTVVQALGILQTLVTLQAVQVFNMMGFPPSMWNKINIHIGGTYGKTAEDKQATLERFIV